ncbi:alpha/beta hydrolase family esterase [Corynebacterium doosanense]|uniref:Sugar phosphotransferase n=1 Tax=Corynebacterium doosanense CAU 212 = DSM 45436 TaxID=558173 RepID=A0A097IHD7_9CORY|nr:alpha/beta fold hydrolase [Corynebacterium doosanense]AIT61544.1 sugar phosphotransferase [Corynebacterium doosanense CAU 212 = DSM 45436]
MKLRLRSALTATCAALACATMSVPVASAQLSSQSSLPSLSSSQATESGEAATTGTLGNADIRTLPSGRTFLVVKPQNYDPAQTYPVILAFGGWNVTPERMMRDTRIDGAAPDAVVIYPAGIDNAWAGAPYAATSINQDVAFIRTIIDDAASHYSGNADEVYAVGHSNGGGMAAALACHAPELVDGIATVSGAFYDPTVQGCKSAAVPALLIHDTADGVISYEGGVRHDAPYQGVEKVFASFGTRNTCDMSTLTERVEGPATVVTPAGCLAPTQLLRISGYGHGWPAVPPASATVATFFNSL